VSTGGAVVLADPKPPALRPSWIREPPATCARLRPTRLFLESDPRQRWTTRPADRPAVLRSLRM